MVEGGGKTASPLRCEGLVCVRHAGWSCRLCRLLEGRGFGEDTAVRRGDQAVQQFTDKMETTKTLSMAVLALVAQCSQCAPAEPGSS